MPNCVVRSELELRGPNKGLEIGLRSSRGVRSAQVFALIPNLTTKGAALEVPRGFRGGGVHSNTEEK
eukprot:7486506-Alexandrium_andersonii.AAC.1